MKKKPIYQQLPFAPVTTETLAQWSTNSAINTSVRVAEDDQRVSNKFKLN